MFFLNDSEIADRVGDREYVIFGSFFLITPPRNSFSPFSPSLNKSLVFYKRILLDQTLFYHILKMKYILIYFGFFILNKRKKKLQR